MQLAQFVRDKYVYHWGIFFNVEQTGGYEDIFRCSEDWINASVNSQTPSLCGQWKDPNPVDSKNVKVIPACWDPASACGSKYDCPEFGTPYYFQCLIPYYAGYSFANNSQDNIAALLPDNACVNALNQLMVLCPCVLSAQALEQVRLAKGGTFSIGEASLVGFCYFLFSRLNRDVVWDKATKKAISSKVTQFGTQLYIGRPGANPENPKFAEPWAVQDWQAVRESLVKFGNFPAPKSKLVTDDDSFNDVLLLIPKKQKTFLNHLKDVLTATGIVYDKYMQPLDGADLPGGMCSKKCGTAMSRLDPSCAAIYLQYPTLPPLWIAKYAKYFPGTACW